MLERWQGLRNLGHEMQMSLHDFSLQRSPWLLLGASHGCVNDARGKDTQRERQRHREREREREREMESEKDRDGEQGLTCPVMRRPGYRELLSKSGQLIFQVE